MLGAVLAACENGTPASPTPVAVSPTPVAVLTILPPPLPGNVQTDVTEAAPTATVPAPATPTEAPVAAGSPTPTEAGLAVSTPDRAALTPQPVATAAHPPGLEYTNGLLYLSGGDLTFYNVETREPWRMVAAEDDTGATANITNFVLDPDGNRLAYLLVTQRGSGANCRTESQIWILDLKEVGPRRQVADSLLPAACTTGPLNTAIAGSLAFASGGHSLAYLSAKDPAGPVTLWSVNSDPKGQGAPVQLFTPQAGLLVGPHWAPDGRQIAFLQASNLDPGGSYDADLTVLPIGTNGGAGAVQVVASGHALPGGRQALPPFDVTWLDTHTLAFQSWNPAHGPDGGWVVDTASTGRPVEIDQDQAGLGAWSPPGPLGVRYYAYRIAGKGVALSTASTPGTLVAPEPQVSGTGAVSPLWSADGSALAFSTSDGRLLIADRAAPGAPAAVSLPSVLHAAWNSIASDPPQLAAIAADGKQIDIFDRNGQALAKATVAGPTSSPQALAWEPVPADATTRRLVVRYAGGANDSTPFVVLTFDPRRHTLAPQSGLPADDAAPLQWVTIGPIPEP